MALQSASSGIQGWGEKIGQYLTGITIVNKAVSGRSARSYTREGKWAAVAALLKAGDYVVIEFGHNDGGDPSTSDRASVYGEGTDTVTVTLSDGTVETVYTWPTYIGKMIDSAIAKGATPIISSQPKKKAPNNIFENVTTPTYAPVRFVPYASNIATKKGVPFVDHYLATYSLYVKLGKTTTEGYFPNDHTHTNDAGANQVAWAFLSGLKCTWAKGVLASYVNSVGQGAGARCSV
ncbi:putative rhamnogalacturonan acetyl esterase [Flagelloscypha sp. PMI_526]|nr:putative rhamnogalacturonan acetyl esterase [Flagelloscypha sp. PMI_526]